MLLHQMAARLLGGGPDEGAERLGVTSAPEKQTGIVGHFPADSIERYSFRYDGKEAFDLLVARYRDGDGAERTAVLFPRGEKESLFSVSPSGLRHDVWQAAAKAISSKAPENALFLSWWDDGQRIHFLSGREAWLRAPSEQSFINPVWKAMRQKLQEASAEERERLVKMARWLTLDAGKALAEMGEYFGKSRPVYLLVTNDLLLRLSEIAAYGGASPPLASKRFPAGENLHGDIAQVKRWANEEGDGNYLVQKEGGYYRAFRPAQGEAKNTLLVRLLPFIDSLKKPPERVSLVYRSRWGAFLSVYKIDLS